MIKFTITDTNKASVCETRAPLTHALKGFHTLSPTLVGCVREAALETALEHFILLRDELEADGLVEQSKIAQIEINRIVKQRKSQ